MKPSERFIHQFISLNDKQAWDNALLEIPHTAWHTHAFCTEQSRAQQQHIVLYVGKDLLSQQQLLCPFVFRNDSLGRDICTPYGYPGFVGAMDDATWLDSWCEAMSAHGYCCGYVLLHPCLSPFSFSPPTVLAHHAYVVDLKRDEIALYNALSLHHKRHLKKLSKFSVTQDKAILIPRFIKLYQDFVIHRRLSAVYDYPQQVLANLLAAPTTHLYGTLANGAIDNISVYLVQDKYSEFFLNASTETARQYSRLNMWHAIKSLRQLGCLHLNLGGGIQENDGLAQFKRQFAAREVEAQAIKVIFNHEAYEQLISDAPSTQYFPAYRAPSNPQKHPI